MAPAAAIAAGRGVAVAPKVSDGAKAPEKSSAKKSDGTDDDFIVVTGKQVLLKFDEAKGSTQRSLTISFPAGTDEITVYGTHVVPEFPVSVLVLVIALISAIFFSKKNIK